MTITEIVIYRIKAEELNSYAALSQTVNDQLKTNPACIRRTVKQDHDDPTLFADIVEWSSLAAAQAAAAAASKDPAMAPFMMAIEEVVSFNHFKAFTE
jgi:quinol monooxygenase YgiN